MEGHLKLIQALCAAHKEMAPIIKDKINPHFRSKYADLPSILEAVTPALLKHEIFISQHVEGSHEHPTLRTIISHAGGGEISSEMPLYCSKMDSQGLGSAITYARRYALCSVLNIAADVDDDGNAASGKPSVAKKEADESVEEPSSKPDSELSEKARAYLENLIKKDAQGWDLVKSKLDIDDVDDLDKAKGMLAIKLLKTRAEARAARG